MRLLIRRQAQGMITAVELDAGDILEFTLRNGETRVLELCETDARILYTNLSKLRESRAGGETLYHFTCRLIVDGCPMTLERYVGSQESFYEPYVINGLRVWFDAVSAAFDFLNENHGQCRPNKEARLAVCDATERICPIDLKPWCPLPQGSLDIADCYNADDCWLGPYFGADAHGGLDINHPKGTEIWAPIDFDTHYLFDSLANGDDNNRWRGTHQWPNGDVWVLQVHHIYNLLVPEHQPIKAGRLYAQAAGAHVGGHEHSHFVFKVRGTDGNEVLLDPWILFWQSYEDAKDRALDIRAVIRPVAPARTGEPVMFCSEGSRPGRLGDSLSFRWTFGDGGWSGEANPTYTFTRPGVYPVTLIVFDGAQQAVTTQHITVQGEPVRQPALALVGQDEFTFRPRPVHAMWVYGEQIRYMPHTLYFTARATRPIPAEKKVRLQNLGSGVLPQASALSVTYVDGEGWLKPRLEGDGNQQVVCVQVNATDLSPGLYRARVDVACLGALNPKQGFDVHLLVPSQQALHRELGNLAGEVVDDASIGFYCTPWFWVGPKVRRKGCNGFLLMNGERARRGEFARFTPDLASGSYRVSLAEETPFEDNAGFWVRVRHRHGDEKIWVEPARSRTIGVFEFDEGTDGFVEILAEGSTGQVLVDAIVFAVA